jgi:aerobic-type carbon monoxide dehydrogenase small subunit (CoxS/CutS family)
MAIPLLVNGIQHLVDASPDEPLLTALRGRLGLTGTKYGCGEGQCGACTVLLDGKPVRSCRLPLSTATQKKITTIEGLAQGDRLHPVQEAFLRAEAFQCAYCTSGMIMSAVGLLQKNAKPSTLEITRHMDGNICRCGTYPRILAAIQDAAARNR